MTCGAKIHYQPPVGEPATFTCDRRLLHTGRHHGIEGDVSVEWARGITSSGGFQSPATPPVSPQQPSEAPQGTPEPQEAAEMSYGETLAVARAAVAHDIEHLQAEAARLRSKWQEAEQLVEQFTIAAYHWKARTEQAEADAALLRSEAQDAHAALDQAEAEVERLRRNTAGLYDRAHKAEQRLAALRGRVEALADEHWDWKAGRVLHDRLRAALSEQPVAARSAAPVATSTPAPGDDAGCGHPNHGNWDKHNCQPFLDDTARADGTEGGQ